MENISIEVRHPYIENSDIRLRKICNKKAKELYGDFIPEEVSERIEWEMEAIQRTGMTFAFIMLKELLEKNHLTSNDITVKGTASGSFVLYLCGICNCNPLDLGLLPYFTFGFDMDKWIDIDICVPRNMQEQVIKSCSTLEGVSGIIRVGEHNDGVVFIPSYIEIDDVKNVHIDGNNIKFTNNDYCIDNKIYYRQDILVEDDVRLGYRLSHRLNVCEE